MDTSKEYIQMCEKAGEIQSLEREKVTGDVFHDRHAGGENKTYILQYAQVIASIEEKSIVQYGTWLPRQDQLQELANYESSEGRYYYLLSDFCDWIPRKGVRNEGKGDINCNSMEQLWLAFTMKRKFNKIWDSGTKEWEVI